ncbi:TolC family protein [Rikenella microfusus]|uniref:TolC family protein n=1 Tax=Rikenella microfusus TaxID=28139 RepID=UPI001DB4C97C|nr:TolC family protein [Rikenella microfusus]HJE88463.1 TolC family protein [Rikenella microfusus]
MAIGLFLLLVQVNAQQRMTLDECVDRAVQSNFGIQVAGMQTQQAANNVTVAPFVPTLTGTAQQNRTTEEKTADGRAVNTLGAGVSLTWRLFDGLGMFATHNLQREQLNVSQLQMRDELEVLVSDIMKQYYLLISLHNQVSLARELMDLSQLRYKEALDKAEIGSASKLEMRLAKIDLNADSSNLIKQEEALRVAYIQMNRMMNSPLSDRGYVNDTILLREQLAREDLMRWADENNVSVLMARAGVRIADLDYKLARAARYPTLDFSAGYNINATDRPNFSGTFSNSNGVNWGFDLGVNIFNGLETNRKLKNARLDRSISETSLSDTELAVRSELEQLYINYLNNLQLIDFERENADVARMNLEAAMLRYKVGDLSGIDFRNIQQQYLEAVDRKIDVIYQAKISEVSLLTLAGQL